jgi:hypothetical protein
MIMAWPVRVFLLLIAALKAILVIWFFMHVKRLWSAEGGH